MGLDTTTNVPGIITPRPDLVTTGSTYQSAYDWASKFAPDVATQILATRSQGSLTGFLEYMANIEGGSSDSYMWGEDGYRHSLYEGVDLVISTNVFTFVPESGKSLTIRPHDNVQVHDKANDKFAEGYVESVSGNTAVIKNREAADWTGFAEDATLVVFGLGNEYAKGSFGQESALERDWDTYTNKHVIFKDMWKIDGSSQTNITWFSDGNGTETWYAKDIDETRERLLDNIEKQLIAGVKTDASSSVSLKGSESLFAAIKERGNNFNGIVSTLAEWKSIIKRLDNVKGEGMNTLFGTRDQVFAIDDMLAGVNGSYTSGTNYGLFDNGKDTALELGFKGFNIGGYNMMYQTAKILKDYRGLGYDDLAPSGKNHAILVPMGNTPVTNNIEGNTIESVPFLTIKYKELGGYSRLWEEFALGSTKGTPANTSKDELQVHMRTERSLRTAGAHKFFKFSGEE